MAEDEEDALSLDMNLDRNGHAMNLHGWRERALPTTAHFCVFARF